MFLQRNNSQICRVKRPVHVHIIVGRHIQKHTHTECYVNFAKAHVHLTQYDVTEAVVEVGKQNTDKTSKVYLVNIAWERRRR